MGSKQRLRGVTRDAEYIDMVKDEVALSCFCRYGFPGSDASATFYTSFKATIHFESGSGGADMLSDYCHRGQVDLIVISRPWR